MARKREPSTRTVQQEGASVERRSREVSRGKNERLVPTIGHYEWDAKSKTYRTVTK